MKIKFRNGEKKMKLENETKTRIKIPKRGQGDWMVIEGQNKSNLASCRNRIQSMIYTARHQKSFTHLLTFPLTFPDLKYQFNKFQDEVLKHCMNDQGVDDSIFQFPDKLHLTICTAVLLNKEEIYEATNLLEKIQNTFIKETLNSKKLIISLRGLEYMNDDPSKVDVLYAKVKQTNGENSIQHIANHLMNKFCDAGLSKKQYDNVKLHATVMNTLKRQDNNCAIKTNVEAPKERESFDARNILKLFGDYDFGSYELEEIHLSLRFSIASNGYYECISKIKLQ
jgi:activating signal cointegrator complex subunit 1